MLKILGILASLLWLAVPAGAPVTRFDFEHGALDGWTTVDGQWAGEEASDAPSGARVLVERATRNAFNVIVAPGGPCNLRLYHYDRGRHELASARLAAQALGHWHTLRVVVVGDRIQGSLE